MIVARVYKFQGGDKMNGSCRIEGYENPLHGWFPAKDFNFGFNANSESEGNGASARGNAPVASGRPTAPAGKGAPSSPDKNKKDEVFRAMSLSKEVDSTTCDLMFLCMEERKSKKGVDSGIRADIHVLASVDVQQQKRFIYPSVMIHLQGVRVEEWSIQGSGDDRPEETVQLKYDKAAICYQRTPDGKTFDAAHERAWDQYNNRSWDYSFKDSPYIVRR